MQLAMDVVIVLNGIVLAMWIFSKAVLNMVLAANKWVRASEPSESQTIEESQGFVARQYFVANRKQE